MAITGRILAEVNLFLNGFVMLPINSRCKKILPDCTKNMSKRSPEKFIEFCDFVLRNFDHRNFAFVSAKFLLYWAKWSV